MLYRETYQCCRVCIGTAGDFFNKKYGETSEWLLFRQLLLLQGLLLLLQGINGLLHTL